MKSRFLLKIAAIVLFAGFVAGNSANQSPVFDLGVLSDPQTSKIIGQMFAAPIVEAIKERNEESPFLAIPFGDLIGAGLQLLGGLVGKKQPPSAAHTDTSVTRTDLHSQSNAHSGRNIQGIPGQPLYSNGYFDQNGIFRPYQPIYNGPYVENQQGVYQIPQQQPIAPGGQNGPKHNLPMSGYPVYSGGFYDENGIFRPYQLIYNSPYVNNQQGPYINDRVSQNSQQYSKTADGVNGPANREVIVQNRPVTQTNQPMTDTNLVEQTTSENRKQDGLRYSQNFPSTSNTNLPVDHDFANPVDVDTIGDGSPIPGLPDSARLPSSQTASSVNNHQGSIPTSVASAQAVSAPSDTMRAISNRPLSPSSTNLPVDHDFANPVDVDTIGDGSPIPGLPGSARLPSSQTASSVNNQQGSIPTSVASAQAVAARSDTMRAISNRPLSPSSTNLPDNYDFANPVDVDTTRQGARSIVLPTPGNRNYHVLHSTVMDRESMGESISQRLVKIAASKGQGPCLPDDFDFSQPADVDKVRCGRFRLNLSGQT